MKFTSRQVLDRKHGLIIGRAYWLAIQAFRTPEISQKHYKEVSRRHACIKFDLDEQRFYLEDQNSKNKIRWRYLGAGGNEPPAFVEDRLYLDQDMQVWIGSLPLEIRISREAPDIPDAIPNRAALCALVLFQLFGILLFLCQHGVPTIQICLPPALLATAAFIIFGTCSGCRPACLLTMVGLTAAYFVLITTSTCPELAAKYALSFLYPYGAVPLCMAKTWGKFQKRFSLIVKLAVTISLTAMLNSLGKGDGVSTVVLLFLLLTDDPGLHGTLTDVF